MPYPYTGVPYPSASESPSSPKYNKALDYSLNRLDENLRNLKRLMLDHLKDRREFYKNTYDSNSTLMKILAPTIVVPIAYSATPAASATPATPATPAASATLYLILALMLYKISFSEKTYGF